MDPLGQRVRRPRPARPLPRAVRCRLDANRDVSGLRQRHEQCSHLQARDLHTARIAPAAARPSRRRHLGSRHPAADRWNAAWLVLRVVGGVAGACGLPGFAGLREPVPHSGFVLGNACGWCGHRRLPGVDSAFCGLGAVVSAVGAALEFRGNPGAARRVRLSNDLLARGLSGRNRAAHRARCLPGAAQAARRGSPACLQSPTGLQPYAGRSDVVAGGSGVGLGLIHARPHRRQRTRPAQPRRALAAGPEPASDSRRLGARDRSGALAFPLRRNSIRRRVSGKHGTHHRTKQPLRSTRRPTQPASARRSVRADTACADRGEHAAARQLRRSCRQSHALTPECVRNAPVV